MGPGTWDRKPLKKDRMGWKDGMGWGIACCSDFFWLNFSTFFDVFVLLNFSTCLFLFFFAQLALVIFVSVFV
jgi:hypothetical protein